MPTPAPTFTGSTVEVDSIQNGTETDSATVNVEGTDIVVDGTVWGSNGCQTAELAPVNYNSEAGELTVSVRTVEDSEAGDVCTTGIVEIDYTATVECENGTPETVVVTHDRGDGPETVLTTSS